MTALPSFVSPAIESSGARFSSPESGAPFSVLVVEDQAVMRAALVTELHQAGVTQVLEAENGRSALALFRSERPDLVLLDVMMPHKSGFDVCQEVRARDDVRQTRILMLTAKGRDTDVAKGLALGADAYMTKPFSTKELVGKVRDMLGASA